MTRSSLPTRAALRVLWPAALLGLVGLVALPACSTTSSSAAEPPPMDRPAPVTVATVAARQAPITRTFRATGTLLADEQAEVSAELAGRVVATPVERGTLVRQGTVLVQLSATEASAQLAEADANAAQVAAALDLGPSGEFDVERVPDVANARAELELAQAEYNRIASLLEERVVSQSEYDQRRTQVEAARQRYEAQRNASRQRYRSYEAARARVLLARKGLADTAVRSPFDGVVAERKVSVGDYVNKGTAVVTVVRVHPLRAELSIAEQDVARIRAGRPITFRVDAYPDRTFTGTVRFVSPALRADQRAMTIEAIVPNPDGALKPGLFVTAEVAEPETHEALLVPRQAVREVGNTRRVFVIRSERLEDRIVTLGQLAGERVEVTSGLADGDVVALPGSHALAEGTAVRALARTTTAPAEAVN
jgi:RND family efflux transporter MFP subunit